MLPRLQIPQLRPRTVFDSFGQPPPFDYQESQAVAQPSIDYGEDIEPQPPIDYGEEILSQPLIEPELQRQMNPIVDERAIEEMRLRELYKPQTQASERFNQLLGEFPEREEPGFMRKLAAAGAGVGNIEMRRPGGIDESEKVLHAPYYRDLGEWKTKAEPFGRAADIERQGNIQERTLASNIIQNERENRRITEQSRIADERNRIAKIRAVAYQLKQEGWTFKVMGDRVIGYKPDGSTQDFGSSGGMDEADKIELQNKGRIEAARQFGANQANVATMRGGEIYQQNGRTYRINSVTGEKEDITGEAGPGTLTRPGTPSGAGGRGGNYADTQNEKLRQIYTERPEFSDLIIPATTQGGSWQIARPPVDRGWGRGVDQDKARLYDELRRLMGLPPYFNSPNQQQQNAAPSAVSPPQELGSTAVPSLNQSQQRAQQNRVIRNPMVGPTGEQAFGELRTGPTTEQAYPSQSEMRAFQSRAQQVPPQSQPQVQQQQQGIEPGYVAIRINETGEIVQIPQSNLQRALATGKYTQVQ